MLAVALAILSQLQVCALIINNRIIEIGEDYKYIDINRYRYIHRNHCPKFILSFFNHMTGQRGTAASFCITVNYLRLYVHVIPLVIFIKYYGIIWHKWILLVSHLPWLPLLCYLPGKPFSSFRIILHSSSTILVVGTLALQHSSSSSEMTTLSDCECIL